MVLSAADVESASVENRFGAWIVRVHLSPNGSAALQRVFRENFHRLLAIDMGGKVVNTTALFEPERPLGPSFDDEMEIAGVVTASNARAVAAAVKG
jgi:preprotein translocase subunit SecD